MGREIHHFRPCEILGTIFFMCKMKKNSLHAVNADIKIHSCFSEIIRSYRTIYIWGNLRDGFGICPETLYARKKICTNY